jgi:Trk K+ transport system NAD-binding subunit
MDSIGFIALSATGMASPAFASAAAGVDVTRPITIEGETLSLARLKVAPGSDLSGRMISEIEKAYILSVVLLRRDGNADLHPAADRRLTEGDTLAVLGGPPQITELIQDNHIY